MRVSRCALAILAGVFLLLPINAKKVEAASFDQTNLYSLTNSERQVAGLSSLTSNSQLEAAALAKARDMLARDYWAHYTPDGRAPWEFIKSNKYGYKSAGENLAMDFTTADGVIQGWLASPSHRANLMAEQFSEIGIAVVDGKLQGRQTTLVVAFYAKPKKSAAPKNTPQPVAQTKAVSATAKKLEINPEYLRWVSLIFGTIGYRVIPPDSIELTKG